MGERRHPRPAGGWPRYARWHAIYRFEVFLSAAIGLAAGLGWAATGFGYFWPGWLWFALAVPLALQGAVRWGLRAPKGRRLLSVHASVSFALGDDLAIWLLSGLGYLAGVADPGPGARAQRARLFRAVPPERANRRWPTGWTC